MTKDIDRQIDTKRRKFREEILKEEEELRKSRKDLEGKRVLLAPEAFAKEARKFRNLESGLQKKVQKRNREFNEFRNLATRAFEKALNKAVLTFAKEKNFTLILRQRQVVLRADALDVTKAVIKILDKAMPAYKLVDRPPKPGK
jgi:Skp family chaperone for outer membrane proteins